MVVFEELLNHLEKSPMDKNIIEFPERTLNGNHQFSNFAWSIRRLLVRILEMKKELEISFLKIQKQKENQTKFLEATLGLLNGLDQWVVFFESETKKFYWNKKAGDFFDFKNFFFHPLVIEFEKNQESQSEKKREISFQDRIYLVTKENLKTGILYTFKDETEKKIFEKKMAFTEKLASIGKLSQQFAHEIRNPLHSLKLECSYLMSQSLKEDWLESVDAISTGIDRLNAVTSRYLQWDEQSLPNQLEEISVEEEIEKVLKTYCSLIAEKKVEIVLLGENQKVLANSFSCETIFSNLLKNAIEAMENSKFKRLEIEVLSDQDHVQVLFRDTGTGFTSLDIFEPFVTTRAEGTGLGLSWVKQASSLIGAKVDCENLNPGAVFRVGFKKSKESYVQSAHC